MAYENPEIKLDDLDNIIKNIDVESETDYTKVENVYFAFIDVLGFKKTFDEYENEKYLKAVSFFNSFDDTLVSCLSSMYNLKQKFENGR